MKVNEILNRLKKGYPEYIQETYDNTGSQIIFNDEFITRIYVCLDADFNTVKDAREKGCNLIISHHPLIFRPLKKIVSIESKSGIIIDIISSKISLYSMHTNFDKIMYKKLSDFLGYPGSLPLMKSNEIENTDTGFGSIIILEKEKSFKQIIDETRSRLGLEFVLYSGDENKTIRSIAFMNGSGGGSIEKVISTHNPDCIITGDVSYHHAKYAIDSGTAVIDAGHFGTEFIFKKLLAESIKEVLYDEKIEIVISDVEKNPFKVYNKNEK